MDTEHDREVGGEEADAAVFALDTDHGLADESKVDETTVRVAEGEAEELENKRILILRGSSMVLEVFSDANKRQHSNAAPLSSWISSESVAYFL